MNEGRLETEFDRWEMGFLTSDERGFGLKQVYCDGKDRYI